MYKSFYFFIQQVISIELFTKILIHSNILKILSAWVSLNKICEGDRNLRNFLVKKNLSKEDRTPIIRILITKVIP